MGEPLQVFEQYFAMKRAIEAAWRWVLRTNPIVVKVSDLVDRVVSKCPDADRKYAADEFKRRLANSPERRPRRSTKSPSAPNPQ